MRSLPAHLHALFLTLCGVLWLFSPPAAADHWPARKYDAGRSGASPDILPEKLVRIWEYDFYLQLEEEPSAEDAEPPLKKRIDCKARYVLLKVSAEGCVVLNLCSSVGCAPHTAA